MTGSISPDIEKLLSTFVSQSHDGYAVLDIDDKFIFANEHFARSVFDSAPTAILGMTFSELIVDCFESQRGPNIDTDDISIWLKAANQKRWKQQFRSFEIDLLDGRWYLLTEQVINGRYLFTHATDVTRTKRMERELLKAQGKLVEKAFIDDLTQIANRRLFMERANQELNKAKRNQTYIQLFLFDVDHFKSINDNYGHQAGDHILTSLAQLVKSQLRNYDILARVGGEEFAIIFTDTEVATASQLIERLRDSIEKAKMDYNEKIIPFTVSFGGTTSRPDDDLSAILKRADNSLYRAKDAGRNRIVFEY